MTAPAFDDLWSAPPAGHPSGFDAAWNSARPPKRYAAPPAEQPDENPSYLSRFATHLLNTAQGIPGVEAVEAGAGAVGSHMPWSDRPLSYGESLKTLRDATGRIGSKTATGERMMGSVATLPFLPTNPATAGAVLGGADQALSADPVNSSGDLAMRAGKTALGAGAGYLGGKLLGTTFAGLHSLATPSAAAQLLTKQAERAASAKRLYAAAMNEGHGNTFTKPIVDFLTEPDIQEIVQELKQTRAFKGVTEESPEMLDAVYKTLSDRAATIKKGLESVSPSRPNIGRFRGQDVKAAQETALSAMDQPMPSYRAAVDDFATRSREMDAIKKGYDALRSKMAGGLPSSKQLTKSTPEAFLDWLKDATPAEATAAQRGVLGATKMAMMKAPLTAGRHAASAAAPSLLPDAASTQLARLGLLAAHSY